VFSSLALVPKLAPTVLFSTRIVNRVPGSITARRAERLDSHSLPLPFFQFVHVSPPSQVSEPPLYGVGSGLPQQGVGENSNGTMEIFAPALRRGTGRFGYLDLAAWTSTGHYAYAVGIRESVSIVTGQDNDSVSRTLWDWTNYSVSTNTIRISKSKFVAGVQCLKRLYFEVHQPELAAEPDGASKAVMEQGHQVGLVAQKAFPGGVMVEAGHTELAKAIPVTRELIAKAEAPAIFEATFQHGGVLVRADVLKRSGRSGQRLIEVKSSTRVKPHHAYDIAIQRHVLTGADIEVQQASLMHLNREYVFDGKEYDVSQLFVEAEVKPEDAVSETEISDRLKEQFRILNRSKPPDIKPGAQCENPYRCEFYDQCNPGLPADHVSFLPRINANKVEKLTVAGITSIKKIPVAFPLSEIQRRAVECVKSGKPFIGPELAHELDGLKYPLCFMDFETVFPALPRFAKMAPYDQIPFQWSVHRQEKPGGPVEHFEFLAGNDSDWRLPFVDSLCKVVAGARNIVVYNKSFELSRLNDLARWLPAYTSDVKAIKAKLWDLLDVVRRNIYHPAFAGSFSLKSVLPAFVPDMTYENLEVAEGTAAGLAWARFIEPATPPAEKSRLRQALLAYCKQDTLALVRLLEELRARTGKLRKRP
jgi:hypothetical protein